MSNLSIGLRRGFWLAALAAISLISVAAVSNAMGSAEESPGLREAAIAAIDSALVNRVFDQRVVFAARPTSAHMENTWDAVVANFHDATTADPTLLLHCQQPDANRLEVCSIPEDVLFVDVTEVRLVTEARGEVEVVLLDQIARRLTTETRTFRVERFDANKWRATEVLARSIGG